MNSRLRWRSSTSGVDLAGEQIDPGRRLSGAGRAFVLMIPREARMAAWHWRQIWRRRCDGLNSRLLVVGDDRHRLLRISPPWQRLFSGPGPRGRHTELPPSWARTRRRGVPDSSAYPVRLDFLLTEKLAHGALSQTGETLVTRRRSALARMAGQKPCRPQFMRIAVPFSWPCRRPKIPTRPLPPA